MPRYATLLQFSDLHVVRHLTIDPRGWSAQAIYALKAKPHSFPRLDAFSASVTTLKAARPIDVMVGTGDLTTSGDEPALDTVRRFIDDAKVYQGSAGRFAVDGLDRKGAGRLLLPGNHDRYNRSWLPGQTHSDRFERVLNTPKQYPYVVGFSPQVPGGPTFLFFVFDSTPSMSVTYSLLQPFMPRRFKPWQITARGRIDDSECRELIRLSQDVSRSGTVTGLHGETLHVDFDRAVRVAVLHHHPFDDNPTTLMENSELFLDSCVEAGIDIVLFGHDHRAFFRFITVPAGRMYLFCCPSTTEYSAQNGFYVFDFYRDGGTVGFNFELHEWNGTAFARTEHHYERLARQF